jgi:Uma2 family endonuclease
VAVATRPRRADLPRLNVDLPTASHLEPDVAFFAPGHEVWRDALLPEASPDIVVEVSAPSTRRYDLGVKREEYAAHGVGEFWFVDLDEQLVLVFSDGVNEPVRYARGEAVTTELLPGFTLPVDNVLAA